MSVQEHPALPGSDRRIGADADSVWALRSSLAWTIVGSVVALCLLLPLSRIRLEYQSFQSLLTVVAFLLFCAFVCRKRAFLKCSHVMEALAAGICLSVLVLISSYLAISLGYPLADGRLADIDRWLGFDGAAFIRTVDTMPLLSTILMYAYASFGVQLTFLPILLILLGHSRRAFGLVLAYALTCYASSLISVFFPAVGANVTYGIAATDLSSINAQFGFAFLNEFHAVRDLPVFTLSLATAQGILTFPSVHTAVAVLCAAFAFGSRWLRYPFLFLNLAMATSTLTHGGHYLIDVIAGCGVAGLAYFAVSLLAQRGRAPFRQASPVAVA